MEWKEVLLGELVDIYDSKRIPLTSQEREKIKGDIPYYGAQGIIDYINQFLFDGEYILIAEDGNNIISRQENIAQIAKGKFWVNNHAHILQGKIEQNLLCYIINHTDISGYVTGSAQPKLNQANLLKIPIKIPVNLSDQRKIAGILSALDSKIENNNKINANLEAQAQALFKSWFVDFTPFKDQPFVDSELGPIPQGWKVGKLGDICTFKRGKNLLSKNAIDEGVPVVAGGLSPSCYHNQANTSAPVVTVSGSGANAGFMRMYHVDVWASDCSFIDVSCDYLYFVYCFLSVNRRLLKHAQTGAVQPHVKPADIHDFDVVIPEEDIVKAFQSIIKELLTKVGVNEKENQRLAALRDTLLPKLMSGEIKL